MRLAETWKSRAARVVERAAKKSCTEIDKETVEEAEAVGRDVGDTDYGEGLDDAL